MGMIKRFFKRVGSETPPRDKNHGKISTVIGTTCATVLALGLVANPIGMIALAVGATVFGGKAIFHAQKVLK